MPIEWLKVLGWQNNGDRKRRLAILLLFIVGLLVNMSVLKWWLLPRNAALAEMRQQKQNLEEQLSDWHSRRVSAQTDDVHPSSTLPGLLVQVPANDGMASFLLDLEKMTENTGIVLSALTVQPVPDSEEQDTSGKSSAEKGQRQNGGQGWTIREHPLQLSLEGTYEQILQFVREMQQMERIVTIRSWQIQSPAVFDTVSAEVDEEILSGLKYTLQIGCSVYSAESLPLEQFDR